MDFFIIFGAGMIVGSAVTVLIIRWSLQQLCRIMAEQLANETSKPSARVELEVEVDGKVFLCYNKATKEFVCQGASVEEIQQNFVSRFPNSDGVIVGGPKEALDVIKQQLKDSHFGKPVNNGN